MSVATVSIPDPELGLAPLAAQDGPFPDGGGLTDGGEIPTRLELLLVQFVVELFGFVELLVQRREHQQRLELQLQQQHLELQLQQRRLEQLGKGLNRFLLWFGCGKMAAAGEGWVWVRLRRWMPRLEFDDRTKGTVVPLHIERALPAIRAVGVVRKHSFVQGNGLLMMGFLLQLQIRLVLPLMTSCIHKS